MTFRDREKQRLLPLKPQLFSAEACEPGAYRNVPRYFCLRQDRAEENLHASIRDEAIAYFKMRRIGWHEGKEDRPSNHLCCSQCCCVNFWFPFVRAPEALATVLRNLGYDVAEILPFELDCMKADSYPYVAFEWIGERNYLKEQTGGRVASDGTRSRGANFTSLDFAFRFRRTDGRIQIVAGEWKYTENYPVNQDLRISNRSTNRLCIYQPFLEQPDCQINLGDIPSKALFFDPFDQLMRQQLLCSSMERCHEMGADIVSLLHIVPAANREFMDCVTSPELKSIGSDIHQIWTKLVNAERFSGVYIENLLPLVCQYAPKPTWATYMKLRYGDMQ